jgi:hypothetical protein
MCSEALLKQVRSYQVSLSMSSTSVFLPMLFCMIALMQSTFFFCHIFSSMHHHSTCSAIELSCRRRPVASFCGSLFVAKKRGFGFHGGPEIDPVELFS